MKTKRMMTLEPGVLERAVGNSVSLSTQMRIRFRQRLSLEFCDYLRKRIEPTHTVDDVRGICYDYMAQLEEYEVTKALSIKTARFIPIEDDTAMFYFLDHNKRQVLGIEIQWRLPEDKEALYKP